MISGALYRILFAVAHFLAILVSPFHRKVGEGLAGRKNTMELVNAFFANHRSGKNVYWFHASSHGEYEQARPVIAGLKAIDPAITCIASFFSPSGYNHVNDPNLSLKFYLPLDYRDSCRAVISRIRPTKLIFAEYDVWPELIWEARRQGIRTALFSARVRPGSPKLWPVLRGFYRGVYSSIEHIYTVAEPDRAKVSELIGDHSASKIQVLGSPRYDRVKELADQFTLERTRSVLDRDLRLIIGSAHVSDEPILISAVADLCKRNPSFGAYWAYHEPSETLVQTLANRLRSEGITVGLFSREEHSAQVVLVDTVGHLARLYWRGRFAYVGGGLAGNVHNVMEPAIARLPVLFGPRYGNSDAAEQLVEANAGFPVRTAADIIETITRLIADRDLYLKTSLAATEVIHRNVGSATRIVRAIVRD